jgi:hypothetical protein
MDPTVPRPADLRTVNHVPPIALISSGSNAGGTIAEQQVRALHDFDQRRRPIIAGYPFGLNASK